MLCVLNWLYKEETVFLQKMNRKGKSVFYFEI